MSEVWRENNFQAIISYPAKLSIKHARKDKISKCIFHVSLFKKLLEDMLHQNKVVKKEQDMRLTTTITTNKQKWEDPTEKEKREF